MDKLDLYKVIAGIDDETVDRAIETEEKLKRRKSILKKRIITVSVLAATFLIISGAVAAISDRIIRLLKALRDRVATRKCW